MGVNFPEKKRFVTWPLIVSSLSCYQWQPLLYLMLPVATSTLAMGVNLPAHLVVVKSTEHYVMGVYQEYPEAQVAQMIGRAGRPQVWKDILIHEYHRC